MSPLEDFRAVFWTVMNEPNTLRSKRYRELNYELSLIPDALAGPLRSIYWRAECDYVFTDRDRFPTIRDPDTFLTWCLGLAEEYRRGLLNAGARDEDEEFDQAICLDRADGMERLSRLACDIVRERWRRLQATTG